ncbi:hypothetical protein DL95DRAFT_482452 [Leptodontidium sp. 2 PMI_412]|nr:hypothetical protein DL95DRAFT_482452 [Leptodontidium sp. 2 PMI_412]
MTDLPWGTLPKTIQDAVDALCIIRDDEEDKTREISLMGRIYSQAGVTIIASRPKTAQEGFLHPRIISEQPEFILPFRCANGNIGSVRMFQAYGHNGPEPLDVRGWAMQESLLARRILEFGTRQTRFTCRDDIVGYSDGWMPHPEFHIGRHDKLPDGLHLQGDEAAQRPNMLSVIKDWHWLIWEYTTRQLTVESDRILAISSVAEIYASSIRGPYLAGLWNFAMPTDLLWMVQPPLQKRPAAFQGPSWSWSSVNGQIWSFLCSGSASSAPISRVSFRSFPCDATITNTQLQLESASAPFGAITYGNLTVRGRIKGAEWKQESQRGSEVLCDRLRIPHAPHEFLALRAFSDAQELDGFGVDWAPISLLLIWGSSRRLASQESSVTVDRGGDGYTGLLLRKRDVSTFTRIGIFEFVPEYKPSYEDQRAQSMLVALLRIG